MTHFAQRRPAAVWIGAIVLVVFLGLGSRRYGGALPAFVGAYAGDTLWALAAFLGFGLILRTASTRRVATLALVFSLFIELSQLYHAPWIDTIRRTTLGGLVLGFGFLWSDLACYCVGVGLGVVIEMMVLREEPGDVNGPPR
jgi:hypothetical protein